jgi:hypothetical protein
VSSYFFEPLEINVPENYITAQVLPKHKNERRVAGHSPSPQIFAGFVERIFPFVLDYPGNFQDFAEIKRNRNKIPLAARNFGHRRNIL